MKKLLFVIILLLVAILMVLTRPTMAEHKAAMLDVIGDFVEEETRHSLGINLLSFDDAKVRRFFVLHKNFGMENA